MLLGWASCYLHRQYCALQDGCKGCLKTSNRKAIGKNNAMQGTARPPPAPSMSGGLGPPAAAACSETADLPARLAILMEELALLHPVVALPLHSKVAP